MTLKTYPISFGKYYRHKVSMLVKLRRVEICNGEIDYSLYVGTGQPKLNSVTGSVNRL